MKYDPIIVSEVGVDVEVKVARSSSHGLVGVTTRSLSVTSASGHALKLLQLLRSLITSSRQTFSEARHDDVELTVHIIVQVVGGQHDHLRLRYDRAASVTTCTHHVARRIPFTFTAVYGVTKAQWSSVGSNVLTPSSTRWDDAHYTRRTSALLVLDL